MDIVTLNKEKKNSQPQSQQFGNFHGHQVENRDIITNRSKSEIIEELQIALLAREMECNELYEENICLKQKLEGLDHSFAQSFLDQSEENNDILHNERPIRKIVVKDKDIESKQTKKGKESFEGLRFERENKFDQGAEKRLMERKIADLASILDLRNKKCNELYLETVALKQKINDIDQFNTRRLDQQDENDDTLRSKKSGIGIKSSNKKNVKQSLEALRLELKEEFDQGAPERLMLRVKTLDEQLEASYASNYNLKLAILFLSTCFVGYVAHENSALVKEGLKSVDFVKIQLFMKSNFVKLMNFLKVAYKEFLVAFKHVDRNYLLMACRNLGITVVGGFALCLFIKVITKIERIMHAVNRLMVKVCEWRGAILLLLIAALVAYNQRIAKV